MSSVRQELRPKAVCSVGAGGGAACVVGSSAGTEGALGSKEEFLAAAGAGLRPFVAAGEETHSCRSRTAWLGCSICGLS